MIMMPFIARPAANFSISKTREWSRRLCTDCFLQGYCQITLALHAQLCEAEKTHEQSKLAGQRRDRRRPVDTRFGMGRVDHQSGCATVGLQAETCCEAVAE